jgi:hypothetical protein
LDIRFLVWNLRAVGVVALHYQLRAHYPWWWPAMVATVCEEMVLHSNSHSLFDRLDVDSRTPLKYR